MFPREFSVFENLRQCLLNTVLPSRQSQCKNRLQSIGQQPRIASSRQKTWKRATGHQHDSVGGPPNRSSRLSRGRANLANTCLSIHYANMRTGVNADQAFDIVCLTMRQDWGISRTERRINHRFRDNPATIVSSHGSIREGSKYLKNRSGNGTRSDGV